MAYEFDPFKFQGEVARWSSHNFPRNMPHMPFIGIVEEVGELIEAVEKYGKDTMFENIHKQKEAIEDALGDTMVFLADYCWRNGFDLISCGKKAKEEDYKGMDEGAMLINLFVVTGRFAHHHLKQEQNIRMNERHQDKIQLCIGSLIMLLKLTARSMDMDLTECTEKAWVQVRDRDWIKYPKTGRPDAVATKLPPVKDGFLF